MPLYYFFPLVTSDLFPGSLAGGWRAGGVGEKGRGAAAAKDPVAVRQALSGKPPPPEPSLARRPSPAASLELEPGGPHALLTGGAALASSQGKQPSSLPGGCRAGLGGREVPAQHPASLWPPLPSSGLVEGVRFRSSLPPTRVSYGNPCGSGMGGISRGCFTWGSPSLSREKETVTLTYPCG